MARRLWIPIAAVAALVLLGVGGAYAYFFSGLRTTPPALALASPSATASTSATPTAASAGSGTWTVASGSVAGYRVKEQFVGQSSSHEAVARGSAVSGQAAEHRLHDRPAGGHHRGLATADPVGLSSGRAPHAARHLFEAADPLLDGRVSAEQPGECASTQGIHYVEVREGRLRGLRRDRLRCTLELAQRGGERQRVA